MPNYPLLDKVGFQHGFKENMRSIPTSQSSNIKQKKQQWFHKLNTWKDYKIARNIESSKAWFDFQGTILTCNEGNQGVNVGGWPNVTHDHIYENNYL
jgi:hypothetical protein